MTQAGIPSERTKFPATLVVGIGVVIVFLALFALEISHGLVRENGTIAKSMFAFPPTLVLFYGMLTRRRWALMFARVAALLGSLWFFGWAVAAAIMQPHDEYGAVWIWISCVSLVLCGLTTIAYIGLGGQAVKQHYSLTCPECDTPAMGRSMYFAVRLSCANCGNFWMPHHGREATPQAAPHPTP